MNLQSINPVHSLGYNEPFMIKVKNSDVIVRDPEIHDAATYDDPDIGYVWAQQDITYATLKKKKRSRKKKKPKKKKSKKTK